MHWCARLNAHRIELVRAPERIRAEASKDHAIAVLNTVQDIEIAALNALRGERGYLLTNDTSYLEPLNVDGQGGLALTRELTSLVKEDSRQLVVAHSVERDYRNMLTLLQTIVQAHKTGAKDEALTMVRTGEGRLALKKISAKLAQVAERETILLREQSALARDRAEASEAYQYVLSSAGLALMLLAGLAVGAVRRAVAAEARVRTELRRRAMTDELTGLANRREFMASLDRAVATAKRNGSPLALALALIDIDHFKRINDTYGHPAGDAVIRAIATTSVDVVRAQDTVGRLDGEEFAIILPNCSPGDAFVCCERLRMAIGTLDLEMETGEPICVTVSTGLATYLSGDAAEAMIERADAALYDAKNAARDRVKLAA
ncbi:MAG: diguanylate cyclase [Erythrobacter sp.]|nr:diguanylate cyclase [Erythrobacter sp.]